MSDSNVRDERLNPSIRHDERAREALVNAVSPQPGPFVYDIVDRILTAVAADGLVVVDAAWLEGLRKQLNHAKSLAGSRRAERDAARALVDEWAQRAGDTRAEVERLRAAARRVIADYHEHRECQDCDAGIKALHAALAGDVPPHIHYSPGAYARTCTSQATTCRAGVDAGLLPLAPTGDGEGS